MYSKKGPTGRLNTKFHNPIGALLRFPNYWEKREGRILIKEIINLFPEYEK